MTRNPLFIYIPVLIAMLIWSFSFIWYKQVFVYYDPVTLVVFRLAIAVPFLFIISLLFKKLERLKRPDVKLFLLLGFFEPFLYFMGECYGVNLISPTLASIIISLIPLIAPIPAWYIFRERLSITNFMGLIISIFGACIVVLGDSQSGSTSIWGILLMFVAALSAVGHSVFVRKLASRYNTFTIVTWQSTIGMVYFLPFFAIMEFNQFIHMHHTFAMVVPVIKLGIFASTFAFLLFVFSIQRIGMIRTNIFVNLIPVFTAILSHFILNEHFGTLKITGIGIVIAGLIFSQLNRKARMTALNT